MKRLKYHVKLEYVGTLRDFQGEEYADYDLQENSQDIAHLVDYFSAGKAYHKKKFQGTEAFLVNINDGEYADVLTIKPKGFLHADLRAEVCRVNAGLK